MSNMFQCLSFKVEFFSIQHFPTIKFLIFITYKIINPKKMRRYRYQSHITFYSASIKLRSVIPLKTYILNNPMVREVVECLNLKMHIFLSIQTMLLRNVIILAQFGLLGESVKVYKAKQIKIHPPSPTVCEIYIKIFNRNCIAQGPPIKQI